MESSLTDIDGQIGSGREGGLRRTERTLDRQAGSAPGRLQPGLVLDDDGDLPRGSLRRAGIQAESRRQRDRRALPHRGLLSRSGHGRAGDGDGAVHPERIRIRWTEPVDRLWWLTEWPWERLAWYVTAALVFAAPLLVGLGAQAAILNCLGYSASARG